MKVHVHRDDVVPVDDVSWLRLDHDLVFVLSADAATPFGASALERAWSMFIDGGIWQWGSPTGLRFDSLYEVVPLPDWTPVMLSTGIEGNGGWTSGLLSDKHFHPAVAAALTRTATDCAQAGWRHIAQPATAVA